ncbi:microtubule-associated protein futsch [Drosophila montana]|uniref:microtubule-associated protein futsch n=1 Tax=Drosophila montana TaxID=40370 RepID=UPI00313B7E83
MAASSATAECKEECKDKDDDALTTTLHSCANDPDFAVICAFFQKFAKDLGLALPNFKHLQEWLTNNDEVAELRDMHIKLLRKTRKTVHEKSWESSVSKFCFGYSLQDAWEIERFGYRNSSLKVKLRILRELLESQFERNAKFRANILTQNASTLRAQPIGRDRLGHAYWLTQDGDCNLRIYQEHLDEEIWQVVATNRDEFVNLIARLRGNEVVLPSKDIGEADEDTTSSSSSSQNAPQPAATGEQRSEQDDDSHEAKVPNLKIKLRTPEQQQQQEQTEPDLKPKKVKPLLITQAKLSGSPAPAKKRPLEDSDGSPPLASEEQHKKQRPTLLDTKRIKKPSRYESTKSEDDNEVDSEDSELDEGEEEEEESLDGEEESLDSAAADEDENERKFNEDDENDEDEDDEDDDDDDNDDEVGEAIEEPTLIVRGQGAGRDCQALPDDIQFLSDFAANEELDAPVGETIVEPLYYVLGSGSGAECLVGNGNTETNAEEEPPAKTEPKATFFFGEPGCLKLSPIKQTPKQETKRSIFDSIGEPETEPEKTNGESLKPAEIAAENEKNVAPVLNGNESPEQQQELETKSQPSFESGKIEAEEKDATPEPTEKPVEIATEKPSATQEISNEQMEEKPEKSEENVEQVYKVRLIETADEALEIVRESIKIETTKEADDLESRKKLPLVAEKTDEDIKKLNKIHAEGEEAPKPIDDATAAEKNAEPAAEPVKETLKNNTKTIANEQTEPQQAPAVAIISESVEPAANGAQIVEADVTAAATAKISIPADDPAAESGNNKELSETVQNELPSTSKVVNPTDNQNVKPEKPIENKSLEQSCEAKETKDSKPGIAVSSAAPVSQDRKLMLLPNRKRRLAEFAAPAARQSTSESELDVHGELQLEDEQQQHLDALDNDDDLDIGGKRIKMRPKITNVEVRRKVEAQKTQIEETTSSSGEEDARSRRKIIAPKRHLEKPNPVKQKPTLAEIIEKKLKKTPEKPKEELPEQKPAQPPPPNPATMTTTMTQPVNEVTPPAVAKVEPVPFTPPKKSPITKPLKKNLLTQIRQEESDEEAIPRKRTNSETVVGPAPVNPGFESTLQRKRRSSEEAKESKEASASGEELPATSEKLKRNNDQQFLEEELPTSAPQQSQPVKQSTPQPPATQATPPPVKQATPPPVKQFAAAPVKQATPPPVKQATPPPVKQATPPPVIQAAPTPVKHATPPPVKQATPPPVKQTTSPPVKQAAAPPVKQATSPPVKQAAAPPVKQATPPPVKQAAAPPVKQVTPPPVKQATPPPVKQASPPPIKQAAAAPVKQETLPVKKATTPPGKQATPPSVKKEAQLVKQATPPAAKEDTPPPAESLGRRSGRRGGAAVVYSELPQPKRTRGGPKEKPVVEIKQHIKEDPLKIEEDVKDEEKREEEEQPQTAKTKEEPQEESKSDPLAEEELTIEEEPKSKEESEEPAEKPKSSEPKEEIAKPAGVGRGRGPRKKREVDTTNIIDTNDSETPVRQSRRIAQQKIKEEAERRKLEEVALRTMKQQLKNKKKAEKESDPTVLEPSAESESFESASEAEETKKKIKKKCPGKDGWSSDSEEQAETEEEEEEPPHYETDPGSPLFKSDHEFSPESELEDDSQVVPMKRARTLRKENADEEDYAAAADADEACQKCGKSDHPEWILLCDTPGCNKGYHCSCLSPVLFYIPEGDWHCPPCQQEQLIVALEQKLQQFDDLVARKHQEKLLAEEAVRQAEAAAAARTASELEERSNAKKKDDKDDGEDDEDDDDDDDDDDDEGDGSSKANKRSKPEKTKRRRGDGRSNRRAAKRGTRRRRGGKNDASDSGSSATKGGNQQSGGVGGARSGGSSSSSDSSSSNSSNYSDSDDEPIYKLRKRRQINVSYRLNEYDDLINSALKKEMDEVAGAGNLGRGKDISTIIEADKEKTRREEEGDDEPEEGVQAQAKAARVMSETQHKSSNEDDSNDDNEDEQPLKTVGKSKSKASQPVKKKARKLTTLDVSSEEDHGSDEDFKTSSFSDEDSSQSASDDSDSSLEVYRRPGRGKKQRKAARRAARERRKDRKFVVEESDESDEEEQRQQRSKANKSQKKKKKEDSDYTETETDDDDDNGSELSENMDSADLCDDTTSESEDGTWHPSKRKKAAAAKKSSMAIARKSPKLKKPANKKTKQLEYSDDDISESEEEDEEDDDDEVQMGANGAPMSGKGSGKQPRSQPLKKTTTTTATSAQAQSSGKGKGKGKGTKKKKKAASSDDGGGGGGSDERTRTRGRRYAYIEDFDDDSSDGGIKPGVQRPDTPPEERQKFIQKQEEIKRMLAEKNAEGAKLAATPRLTPIKGSTAAGAAGAAAMAAASQQLKQRTPSKVGATPGAGVGDSLSTVPLSVIRQAKVLDIDYLHRKGEAIDDLDDVDSELDDTELPDLPEDMEDAIARMVVEQFNSESSVRDLPPPDEVLRHATPAKAKVSKQLATTPPEPLPSASGLQEPLRKRLPMPTMHPPLLRHQFSPHGPPGGLPASLLPPPPSGQQQHQQPPPGMHPMLQRHLAPPPQAMQLLQNALSAPLGQPLSRANYAPAQQQQPLSAMQRLPLGMSMPAAAAAHLMQAAAAAANVRPPAPAPDSKPRGRRKKVTPLRDQLQKQQTAAAVTAATSSVGNEKPAPSGKAPLPPSSLPAPPQLFKPHEDAPPSVNVSQASVITRMPMPSLLPPAHARGPPQPPPGAGMYPSSAELARFYGQPLPPSSALRPTYGAPPPLRGAPPPTSTGAAPPGSGPNARPPPYLHGPEHHGGPPPPGSLASVYGAGPPPARHASPHLNPYRAPPIYGNPNYPPRVAPPGSANMRPGPVDYAAGARGYPAYGYYPPPLGTPPAHAAAPSSVIVSAPPPPPPATPTNHSVSALTRGKSPAPTTAPAVAPPPTTTAPPPTPPAAVTPELHKSSSVITSKKLITLEAYSNTKSPLAETTTTTADSPAAVAEDDSSSAHGSSSTAVAANSVGGGVGEFSGLVSYFSSQQDDYDT